MLLKEVKMVKTGGILGLAVCSFALTSFAIDWPGEGGTYTVPAGETNTVTEADIAAVNKLAKIVFADKDSAILFTSTTAPAVKFSGKGTVIKEGAADWTLSVLQDDSNWLGNWDIAGGTVRIGAKHETDSNRHTLFGNKTVWRTCRIRKNATLVYDVSAAFSYTEFRLAGTFKVAVHGPSAMFNSVIIEDDAAVIDQTDGKYSWFSRPSDDGGVALDLNGHKLTCKLKINIYNHRGYVKGPGTIRLENETTTMCYFATRNSKACGFPDPTVTIECGDYTGIQHQEHPATNQMATLVVEGVSRFLHQHNVDSVSACPTSPDDPNWTGLFWDGPVVLKNAASTLELDHDLAHGSYHAHMGVNGPVSGLGSLKFAEVSTSYKQTSYYISCPTNTYAGTTKVYGRDDSPYYFSGSNAIPNVAGVTSTSDEFYLAFDPARDDNWTLAKIVDLYREGTYSAYRYRPKLLTKNGEVVLLDGTGLSALGADDVFEPMIAGDGEVKISAPFGDAVFAPHFADPANAPTLTLAGSGTVSVTNLAANATFDFDGLLHITDNARADLCGQPFAASSVKGITPRMKFSNGGSTVLRGVRTDEYYTDRVTDVLAVGYGNGTGRVEIAEGALLTNRVIVGGYSDTSHRPRGVIRQTGGELSLIGQYKDDNSYRQYSSVLGFWGQGGYSLEGGILTFLGHCIGANYGNLVFHQSGGALKAVNYPWGTQATTPTFSVGVTCGTADLIFTGGTADFGGTLYMSRGSNAAVSPQTLSSLTVDGTAEVTVPSLYTMNSAGCVATVNLRGGRLEAQWQASNASTPYDAWVFFDGGTFAFRRDLARGEFGGDTASHAPATLRVGLNGGTLDAQGHYQKVWVPFDALQDGTVTAIPWTDTMTVYPAPPTVVISGPGRHATAYADYDYATGKIRGIVVTCGGEGYVAGETTAQLEYFHANLKYPSAHEDLLKEPIVCTVGNVTSGGMTFRASGVASGSNYIGLNCTNTYAGATTVDMQTDPDTAVPGTVYFYAEDQFPNSRKLVVRSGQLDFNKHVQSSFMELEMTGGKILNYPSGRRLTLERATFGGTPNLGNVPMTVGKIAVDAANPPTLTLAKITAADGAKITVENAAVLADIERGVTLFTCDITDGAKITVENPEDLPANVKLTWRNGRLRASRTDIGSVLIVR